MSRYVDLDGVTWDGTPISSKIQEVKTKYGYMSAITIGWLYGDKVPHIDLGEHDAVIRSQAIDDFLSYVKHEEAEGRIRSLDDYDRIAKWFKGETQ